MGVPDGARLWKKKKGGGVPLSEYGEGLGVFWGREGGREGERGGEGGGGGEVGKGLS